MRQEMRNAYSISVKRAAELRQVLRECSSGVYGTALLELERRDREQQLAGATETEASVVSERSHFSGYAPPGAGEETVARDADAEADAGDASLCLNTADELVEPHLKVRELALCRHLVTVLPVERALEHVAHSHAGEHSCVFPENCASRSRAWALASSSSHGREETIAHGAHAAVSARRPRRTPGG
jgi:hypothetical protein